MTRGGMIAGAAAGGVVAALYGKVLRPGLMRWGANDEEVAAPYPGAEFVPDGERGATMAVTIDVPPDQVWPWLVQLGGDRAGWYSWDRLDNGGRPSAREVHPEWQDVAVGDSVKYWRRGGAVDAWQVAALEPNRFLGLHGLSDLRGRILDPAQPRPRVYTEGLWGFLLTELPNRRTRLLIGGYQAMRPRWLERFANYWIMAPVVWIMQARMLAVLKRNVERAPPRRCVRLFKQIRRIPENGSRSLPRWAPRRGCWPASTHSGQPVFCIAPTTTRLGKSLVALRHDDTPK